MLRAKAIKFKKGIEFRDRLLSSTDAMGKLAAIPVVAQTVNAVNRLKPARAALQAVLGVHKDRELPPLCAEEIFVLGFQRKTIHRPRWQKRAGQGRDLRHLLRELQRAVMATISWRCSSTTRSRTCSWKGSVLRDAEARARRPRGRRSA